MPLVYTLLIVTSNDAKSPRKSFSRHVLAENDRITRWMLMKRVLESDPEGKELATSPAAVTGKVQVFLVYDSHLLELLLQS